MSEQENETGGGHRRTPPVLDHLPGYQRWTGVIPAEGRMGGTFLFSAARRRIFEKTNRLKKCMMPRTTKTNPTLVLRISKAVVASAAFSPYLSARVTNPMLM